MPMTTSTVTCPHTSLVVDASITAAEAGFKRAPYEKRLAAAKPSGRAPTSVQLELEDERTENDVARTFPGPLVLPGDELAWDPKYPPQTLRSFIHQKERNKITRSRTTIYVVGPPELDKTVKDAEGWARPAVLKGSREALEPPRIDDIKDYLSAFYRGLPIASFPEPLSFVPWESAPKARGKSTSRSQASTTYVGLGVGSSCTRIRTRPCPDRAFSRQLNLSDLLDAALEMLPADAFAMILLMRHDLYEDDEDDFCCGRAYGGSRVCVVSSARYHPLLDEAANIDSEHVWPFSHCEDYVKGFACDEPARKKPKKSSAGKHASDPPGPRGPLRAAVETASLRKRTPPDPYALWFSRLCRTASHELAHCMAIDHCVYYACVMQSTSCMAEDVRQPPYLCPVCSAKLSRAVAVEFQGAQDAGADYLEKRDEGLVTLCGRWQGTVMFDGFGAWLEARLRC